MTRIALILALALSLSACQSSMDWSKLKFPPAQDVKP